MRTRHALSLTAGRRSCTATAALALLVALLCSGCGTFTGPVYEPVVTFSCNFDDMYISLPGHAGKPNTCTLKADTIEVWCYSDAYDDSDPTRISGYRIWIQIHPFSIDSTKDFWTGHIRVRFSDFITLGKDPITRVLYPQDTTWGGAFTALGDVEYLQRRVDARLLITDIYVPLHPENVASVSNSITDGRLEGTIERW